MEILKERFLSAQKACGRFQESVLALSEAKATVRPLIRDSAIQRFEFTFEALWKYLRAYLGQQIKIDISELSNARLTFRAAHTEGLITEQQLAVCMNMLEDRNQTSHMYDEELAEGLTERVDEYAKTISAILARIEL